MTGWRDRLTRAAGAWLVGRTTWQGAFLAWAVACLVVSVPAMGWAATYGTAGITSFPTLHVVGNGQDYTEVTESGYEWKGWVELDAKGFALIQGWLLHPSLKVEGQSSLPLWPYEVSDSYPFGKWATYVKKTGMHKEFPGSAVRAFAAQACNRNAQKLREQGRSNTWIFDRQHKIAVEVWATYDVDVTVGDKVLEAGWPIFKEIVCEKWAGSKVAGPDKFQGVMEVKASQFVLFPSAHTGPCPVDVSMFMKVTGNGAGSFEAWVESSDGWKSKKMVRSIAGPQSGEYVEDFSDKLPVPIVLPASSGGGGSGAGSQAAGGKAAVKPGPGDTLAPKSGPPVSPGGLSGTDRPGNVHKASLRLVATAGGKTVASGWQDYTVTCDPKVTAGLKPAENLADAGAPARPKTGVLSAKPEPAPGPTTATPSGGLPDLVSKGVVIGGELVNVGSGVEVLSASKAKGYRDGQCLFRVEYQVDNDGRAKTPGGFRNVLQWDATVIDNHVEPGLDTGDHRTRAFDAYLTPGEHGLTLRVDADRAVEESNEGNNIRTARVRLNGPCSGPQLKGAEPGSAGSSTQMKK